jgi:CHAT domain-containing protein
VTAGELKRYLNYPAFVFLSACEAASADKATTAFNVQGSLIENLAVAVLEGGACSCLGPMWKIADRPAKDFAVAFYEFLFSGKSTGKAVQLACKQIRQRSSDWAAWVLFGNPHMHPLSSVPG